MSCVCPWACLSLQADPVPLSGARRTAGGKSSGEGVLEPLRRKRDLRASFVPEANLGRCPKRPFAADRIADHSAACRAECSGSFRATIKAAGGTEPLCLCHEPFSTNKQSMAVQADVSQFEMTCALSAFKGWRPKEPRTRGQTLVD